MSNEDKFSFPKKADQIRLQQYAHGDLLYKSQHYDAFAIKAEKGFTDLYARLRYVVANFGKLMTNVMADMLFGETLTVDLEDEKNQEFIKKLMERNQLLTQLYESELINSRRGDDVFKIRIGKRNPLDPKAKDEIIIEQISAELYFPVFDDQAARDVVTKEIIAVFFKKDGIDYVHFEIHTPGKIEHEVWQYNQAEKKLGAQANAVDFGYPESEDTGVDRSLIFHVPNVRDGSSFFGSSDYEGLDPLFFALNNRITKVDNILDKHSDPILAVPPGVIDEEGKVKKEAIGMFEVDGETGAKPEYIVWNANLEAAFTEIDKLLDFLFMFSEVAPATMGMDKNGQVESGRALKFKLLATIRKRNRKMLYYDQMIKDLLQTAIELSLAKGVDVDGLKPTKSERPNLIWGDGVINDPTEMIDNAVKRVDAGLSSRADEIAKLDDLDPEEATEKVKEIDEESGPKLPDLSQKPNSDSQAPDDMKNMNTNRPMDDSMMNGTTQNKTNMTRQGR